MPSNCGNLSLDAEGYDGTTKVNPGVLLVRNYDSNGAPRQKITLSGGTCSSTVDCVIFCNQPTKVKLYDAASGGNVVPWSTKYGIQALKANPKDLWLEGVAASAAVRDIEVNLHQDITGSSIDCYCATSVIKATVFWADVSGQYTNPPGPVPLVNNKRDWYQANTLTYDFGGGFLIPQGGTHGMQFSAYMLPNGFNPAQWGADLKSERRIVSDKLYRGLAGSTDAGGRLPGSDDTTLASQDNTPTDSLNYIFDLDAPALRFDASYDVNEIRRRRTNFRQYVLLNGVRASSEYLWYVRHSLKKTDSGNNAIFVDDVPTDNKIDGGTTPTTWHLQ